MFIYQALIMGTVVLIVFLLLFVFRMRNRAALAGLMVLLAVGGAFGLGAIQNVFNPKFYPQPVNVSLLREMQFSDAQRADIGKLFPDYSSVAVGDTTGGAIRTSSDDVAASAVAVTRNYTVTAHGAASKIRVVVYSFASTGEASQYLDIRQRFYNTQNYLPADSGKSLKTESSEHKYITTYIKSMYPDYADFLYFPSKIRFYSEILVQDKNVLVDINEESNKPVVNKGTVIEDILTRIQKN